MGQCQFGQSLQSLQMLGIILGARRFLLDKIFQFFAEILRIQNLMHPLPSLHFIQVLLESIPSVIPRNRECQCQKGNIYLYGSGSLQIADIFGIIGIEICKTASAGPDPVLHAVLFPRHCCQIFCHRSNTDSSVQIKICKQITKILPYLHKIQKY